MDSTADKFSRDIEEFTAKSTAVKAKRELDARDVRIEELEKALAHTERLLRQKKNECQKLKMVIICGCANKNTQPKLVGH